MSKSQRRRRLRRRQAASQTRTAPRTSAVAFTGTLLTTAALAVPGGSASAAPSPADPEPDVALVADIAHGADGSSVREMVEFGDRVILSVDDGRHGRELWVSDGSQAGTRLVADLNTRVGRRQTPGSSSPGELTLFDGSVFFSADDGVHGRELWKTDGTAAGTTMVTDVPPTGEDDYYEYPSGLTVHGGSLFFARDDGVHGTELWRSDGTASGTAMVADINTGTRRGKALGSFPANLTSVGDDLYFTATDVDHGNELWRTDGTAEGTALVADVRPGVDEEYDDQAASSRPRYLTALGDTLYFSATDDTHGTELWRSDGTTDGTALVADLRTVEDEDGYDDAASSRPNALTALGGTLYFSAIDDTHGRELWRSDGTAAGTSMVADINPDPEEYSYFGYYDGLTVLDDTLYFSIDDGTHGTELWRSDGTDAGTRLVKDIATGGDGRRPRSSSPRELTVLDDTLYFAARDGDGHRQLWTSDGTTRGTDLFADVVDANSYYSYGPSDLTAAGGELYFTADDGVYGNELWSTADAAAAVPRVASRAAPRIDGEAVAGGVLTTSTGTWSPASGLDYSYQWYVGDEAVPTATRSRFRPGSSDVGRRISVRVIAHHPGYRGQVAYSASTGPVADEPLVNLARPAARGKATVGSRLTATRGRWSAKGLAFTFRWRIDGQAVPGADGRRFRLPARAAGRSVAVRVTARRPSGAVSVSSKPRAVERR